MQMRRRPRRGDGRGDGAQAEGVPPLLRAGRRSRVRALANAVAAAEGGEARGGEGGEGPAGAGARSREERTRRRGDEESIVVVRLGKGQRAREGLDDDASSDGGNDEPNAIARARATYLAARGIGPTSREETDSDEERARRDRRRMFPSGTGSATGSPTRPAASNGAYERRGEGSGAVDRLAASVRASTSSSNNSDRTSTTGGRRAREHHPRLSSSTTRRRSTGIRLWGRASSSLVHPTSAQLSSVSNNGDIPCREGLAGEHRRQAGRVRAREHRGGG